jgi:hypothetical protein
METRFIGTLKGKMQQSKATRDVSAVRALVTCRFGLADVMVLDLSRKSFGG